MGVLGEDRMVLTTKERMVEAAAGLMRRRGVTATSFSDVLDASGAARGAIYHHFPGGKTELTRDVVAWTGRSVQSRLASLQADDPRAVVAQFLAAVRPAVEQSASGVSCAVTAVTVESAQLDQDLTAVVQVALGSWVEELERQLRRTGAGEAAASTLSVLMVTFLEGAHVLCRAAGSAEPFDRGAVGVLAAADALLSTEGTSEALD